MIISDSEKRNLVDANYKAFQKILPELMKTHAGKFVVMHTQKPVEFMDTFADAVRYGRHLYGELFSVQEITNRPVFVFGPQLATLDAA